MSDWTHAMCEDCWEAAHVTYLPPVRVLGGDPTPCCWCGGPASEIFVREDPRDVPLCQGHPE